MRISKSHTRILAAALLALALAGCGAKDLQPAVQTGGFSVDFLSTGKSDCAVICLEDLVILSDTADANDYEEIAALLTRRGIERIDYIILSHYDRDHIGSAGELIRGFSVGAVLRPDYVENSDEFRDMESAVAQTGTKDIVLKEDYLIKTENGSVKVDPPDKNYGDDNNNSMLTTVTYKGCRALFLGDARKKRMEEFLSVAESAYDLVKLPHHGDSNKPLLLLLQQTRPAWAVEMISRDEAVETDLAELLSEIGTKLFCTRDGSIHAVWADGALSVTQK